MPRGVPDLGGVKVEIRKQRRGFSRLSEYPCMSAFSIASAAPTFTGSSLFSVEWHLPLGGFVLGIAKNPPTCGPGTTTPCHGQPSVGSAKEGNPKNSSKWLGQRKLFSDLQMIF